MTYLIIILVIIIFYLFTKKRSTFGELNYSPVLSQPESEKQVYHLDTRNEYPTVPPVNPVVYNALLINSLPVDKDLYSEQGQSVAGYDLEQNKNTNTNQLEYSGGTTQLLKIPLQMNEPYKEQLRSQDILITPYNKIKYGTNC
jgi:hypothetical protein